MNHGWINIDDDNDDEPPCGVSGHRGIYVAKRFRIEQMLITSGKTAQQGYLSEKLAQCFTLKFWPVDAGVTA